MAYGILIGICLGTSLLSAQTPEFKRGPRGLKLIALTFDAGGECTSFPELLQGLASTKTRCTFFITGKWAQDHPDYIRQLSKQGHEIGNHTWSHHDLTRLSNEAIVTEIKETNDLLERMLGYTPVKIFRAPYGSSDARVLKAVASLGFQSIYWSLDSLDSVGKQKTPEYLFERIAMKNEADLDGAIILMHVGEPSTAKIVPYLIHALRARGFRLVTISQFREQSNNLAEVRSGKYIQTLKER